MATRERHGEACVIRAMAANDDGGVRVNGGIPHLPRRVVFRIVRRDDQAA